MCEEKWLRSRVDELEEKLTGLIDYVYDIGAKVYKKNLRTL